MKINAVKTAVLSVFVFTAVMATMCPHSYAGGDIGNGGGGEVEFKAIATELDHWLSSRLADGTLSQKLGLGGAGISADELYAAYLKYKDSHVIFQDDPIAIAGYSMTPAGRICGNSSSLARVVCNNKNWNASSPQLKYAITFHEILGMAGIEPNQGEYSQYPISKNVIPFVKRSYKFELGENQGNGEIRFDTGTEIDSFPVIIMIGKKMVTRQNGKIVRAVLSDISVEFEGSRYLLADYWNLRTSSNYICEQVKQHFEIMGRRNGFVVNHASQEQLEGKRGFFVRADKGEHFLKYDGLAEGNAIVDAVTCSYLTYE